MSRIVKTFALLTTVNMSCMSSNSKSSEPNSRQEIDKTQGPTVETNTSAANEEASSTATPDTSSTSETSTAAASPATDSLPESTPKDDCDNLRKNYEVPKYLEDVGALIVSVDQACRKDSSGKPFVVPRVKAIGVPYTGGDGRVTKKGHSDVRPEVIEFSIDFGPMKQEQLVKQSIQKNLDLEVSLQHLEFVPLIVQYYEFEGNNDADFSKVARLTLPGGGAQQWNKYNQNQKPMNFPIVLYGHSSSLIASPNIYEAKATIHPLSRRQFNISVQKIQLLDQEQIKALNERCKKRIKNDNECEKAFASSSD